MKMEQIRSLASKGRVALVVDNIAYDFTDFCDDHPGGAEYLRKNMGKVATEEFVASHPVDIIGRTLTDDQMSSMKLGPIDPSTIVSSDVADGGGGGGGHHASAPAPPDGTKPTLASCINIFDFEAIAREVVPEQGWMYYSSGADDEISLRENHSAFQRIWMRPRVLVNVKEVDTSTSILGQTSSLPLMLCAVAMCKLGHPDGETAWSAAAKEQNIPYMVPTLSGCSFTDIMKAGEGGTMHFQLYVHQDRKKTEKLVRKAEAAGCKSLFITVDAPQLGNREKDRRVKVSHSGAAVQSGTSLKKTEGTSKALTTFIDPSLCWDDLAWFAAITKMKIVLKGIASSEDAITALEHGKVAAIMLSNHGGRQLDGARSAIEILPEVMSALRAHPSYDRRNFEVYIDGGIRRGTDVFKALALGATAVGIGRPALYAMSAFGQEGVEKCISIFRAELEMTMRLMGTKTIADIKETSVITTDLARHYAAPPANHLVEATYEPKTTQVLKNGFKRVTTTTTTVTTTTNSTEDESSTKKSGTDGAANGALSPTIQMLFWGVVKSVLSMDPSIALHRSAIFLVVFLVVHSAGLCSVFLGPEIFNEYGDKLRRSMALQFIEAYLLLAFIVHGCVGLCNTFTKRKFILKKPVANGKLALSAVVVTIFVVVHCLQIRFGEYGVRFGVPGASNPMYRDDGVRDMFGEAQKLFQDPMQVMFYLISLLAVGVHLWIGWEKTVRKSESVDKTAREAVTSAGRWGVIVPIVVGFALTPLYFASL
jgi:L-lactate dehydrogenase (cytochrome)